MYSVVAAPARAVVRRIAGCGSLVLLLAASAFAQCKVEGTVQTADGKPIAGATVEILSSALKGAPPQTTTSAEGRYEFDNIKAGIWAEIRVTGTGNPTIREFGLITNWTETIDLHAPRDSDTPMSVDDLSAMGGDAGEIHGVVRSEDGSPVAGAAVAIGDTGAATRTDAAGRYAFGKLRSRLAVALQASATGFEPATANATVPSNAATEVDITLTAAQEQEGAGLQPVDVSGDGTRTIARPGGAISLPSRAPNDVFHDVQFLPALSAAVESSSAFFLRGATPGQSLITYNDFTWYPQSRLFGGLPPFNQEGVASAVVRPDLTGIARGGRLAGAIDTDSDGTVNGRANGGVDISGFGFAAAATVPLGSAASIHVGARRPLTDSLYADMLDRFTNTTYVRSRVPLYASNLFPTAPQPTYGDYDVGATVRPGTRDLVTARYYDANDTGNFSRDWALPASTGSIAIPPTLALPSDAVVQGADAQQWTGRGFSGRWTHSGTTLSTRASFGTSKFTFDRAQDVALTSPTTGLDYNAIAGRGGSSALRESGTLQDSVGRVEAEVRAGFQHAISFGGELQRIDADYAALQESTATATGVPLTPGLAPLYVSTASGQVFTVFGQDVWRPTAALTIAPGARMTHYDITATSYFEPRINATYDMRRSVRFNAGFSIDHQVISDITREDLQHGDGQFWTLANGTSIPVARSQQVSGGVTSEVQGVLVQGQAFYRQLDDVTIFAPRLLPGVVPLDSSAGFYVGSGRAAGVDLLLQQRQGWNSIWAATEVGRTEYTYPGLEPATFRASSDRLFELKVADSVSIRGGFGVTAAWVASKGQPYTPMKSVQQVWFSSGSTAYQPIFAAKNSADLPPYHRLDLTGQFSHRSGPVTSTAGLTVFNIYNRTNIAGYDVETVGNTAAVNDIPLMSRAFNAFFRLGF